jgi:hypothetical protein
MAVQPNPAENLQKALRGKFVPIKIGSQYYNSLDDLQTEFGKEKITETLLARLKEYFVQRTDKLSDDKSHTYIKDENDQNLIKPFLQHRIQLLKDDGRLKYDNSLVGNRKRKILKELEGIVAMLATPASNDDDKAGIDVNKNDIMQKLLNTLWKIASSEGNTIKVKKDWEGILEAADKMPLDELLKEASTVDAPSPNAFKGFIRGDSAPVVKQGDGTPIKGTKVAKMNILKLLALFKSQSAMKQVDNSTNDNTLDKTLTTLQEEIPEIVENVRLSYRTVTRFFRDRYLRTMKGFEKILRNITLPNYPIDTIIRLVFIMTELERYVYKPDIVTSIDRSFFPQNSGLLRITNIPANDLAMVAEVIKQYKEYTIRMQLTNDVEKISPDTNTMNYEIIQMHTRLGRSDSLVKAILQLIRGEIIDFNPTILESTIADLTNKLGIKYDENLQKLQKKMNDIFGNGKQKTLFISFQESPEDLLINKTTRIQQLGELPFFIAEINGKELTPDSKPELTHYIDKELQKALMSAKDFKNTFADFGITSKPLQLVHSITQLTGTLLNTVYINDRLKNKTSKKNA